ncbi:MAG: AAA family ATPase [Bacteroidia bacterium]
MEIPSNNPNLSDLFDNNGRWNEEKIFYATTGKMPSCRRYYSVDPEIGFKALADAFGVSMDNMVIDDYIHITRNHHRKQRAYLFLTPTLLAFWNNAFGGMELFYVNGENTEAFQKAERIMLDSYRFGVGPGKLSFFIQYGEGGLRVIEHKVDYAAPDLDLYFNDSLKDADKKIVEALSDNTSKGIVLLHGAKGTGKTTYLRSLISRIHKKFVIVPMDMIFGIGSPGLLPQFLNLPDSIIVLEDADQLMVDRQGMGNEFIANICDFSDGLLSDCVNLKFILSFSTPMAQVDQSVIRHGRLLGSYEFEALTEEKCNHLLTSMGKELKVDKALTLAEVYQRAMQGEEKKEKKRIGFK